MTTPAREKGRMKKMKKRRNDRNARQQARVLPVDGFENYSFTVAVRSVPVGTLQWRKPAPPRGRQAGPGPASVYEIVSASELQSPVMADARLLHRVRAVKHSRARSRLTAALPVPRVVFDLVNPIPVERTHHAKLDLCLPDHRTAGSPVGLCRDCGDGGGDR